MTALRQRENDAEQREAEKSEIAESSDNAADAQGVKKFMRRRQKICGRDMKKRRFSLAKQQPRRKHRQQREAVGDQPPDVLRQVIRLHMRSLQPARRMRTQAQMPCGKQQRADRKEEQGGMQADTENGGEAEQRKQPCRAALVEQPVRKPRGKQKPEKRRGEEIAVAIQKNRPARHAE